MNDAVVVVDRIEGKIAVLSPLGGEPPFECPLALLPPGTEEGSTLRLVPTAEPEAPITLRRTDDSHVVLALRDGPQIGCRPALVPPDLADGQSLAFVLAPEVEAERRETLAARLERLAEKIDDDEDLVL